MKIPTGFRLFLYRLLSKFNFESSIRNLLSSAFQVTFCFDFSSHASVSLKYVLFLCNCFLICDCKVIVRQARLFVQFQRLCFTVCAF